MCSVILIHPFHVRSRLICFTTTLDVGFTKMRQEIPSVWASVNVTINYLSFIIFRDHLCPTTLTAYWFCSSPVHSAETNLPTLHTSSDQTQPISLLTLHDPLQVFGCLSTCFPIFVYNPFGFYTHRRDNVRSSFLPYVLLGRADICPGRLSSGIDPRQNRVCLWLPIALWTMG